MNTDASEAIAATGTGDLTCEVALPLSCQETGTLAALLRALGYTAAAVREHLASDAGHELWVELEQLDYALTEPLERAG